MPPVRTDRWTRSAGHTGATEVMVPTPRRTLDGGFSEVEDGGSLLQALKHLLAFPEQDLHTTFLYALPGAVSGDGGLPLVSPSHQAGLAIVFHSFSKREVSVPKAPSWSPSLLVVLGPPPLSLTALPPLTWGFSEFQSWTPEADLHLAASDQDWGRFSWKYSEVHFSLYPTPVPPLTPQDARAVQAPGNHPCRTGDALGSGWVSLLLPAMFHLFGWKFPFPPVVLTEPMRGAADLGCCPTDTIGVVGPTSRPSLALPL
ncbi:uncharacterized protein LOC115598657 [Calypte anna]|uniref:uncharacterized protein LOC115598657 n=1 Tax=Calypte anna TaxID=9244 RepID=UPI0011C35CCC|nr:uncharacterized protein LOC115598657 [Calypte anna]